MEAKNIKIEGILDDNYELSGYAVNGVLYEREKDETISQFYSRVATTCQKEGINFHETYITSEPGSIETLTEKEYEKRIMNVYEASEEIKSKINWKKALAVTTALVVGAGVLVHADDIIALIKSDDATSKTVSEYVINEEDPELRAVYEQLLQYEDGAEIVQELELIDDTHARINQIAIDNPDAKGKVAYIEAEEVAAIHDVYNADNIDTKTILENEDTIRCNYFTGQATLINLSQGSRDVQEIDGLFKDPELREQQIEIQDKTQKTLDNLNIATPGFINMLNEIYGTRGSNPELQSEVAFGQPGLAAAITPEMTGETLKNFQEASKKEGGQLGELVEKASKDSKKFAVEDNIVDIEKQALINKALEIMDKKQKLYNYDRTDFDPSTTEKGKDMVKEMLGDIGITQGGDFVQYNKTTKTTKKVSREEAVDKFGEDKVKEKEDKVLVDTDGDGKNDKPLDDANKDEKDKADSYAADYSKGYEAGQNAFINGGSSRASSGSQGYRDGYAAGYANAKSVYDQQVKEDNKTEEKFVEEKQTPTPEPEVETPADETDDSYTFDEEFVPESKGSAYTMRQEESAPVESNEPYVFEETMVQEETTRQAPQTIERDGEMYDMQQGQTTSKTRSIGTNA